MIQLKLILFGVSVVAGIGYAIYTHYQNQERHQRQHSYGPPPRSPENHTMPEERPSASETDNSRKRRQRFKVTGCSICLGNINSWASDTTSLSCGHSFHEHCISVWLNSNKTCPNCRAAV